VGAPEITPAQASDLPAIRAMLREYEAWLGLDLSFQRFDEEVAQLPGDYAPPTGALLIARFKREPAGMVAFRRLVADRCEMKRLFVRPAARGLGLGRRLAERVISEAGQRGYREMVLDTLPVMSDAQRLYVALGFQDIDPYYASAIPGTRYLALALPRSG
jgi:ribosomal protein S18 acetylase RimI-like enzyme